jgi:hypothetical protein
LLSGVGGTGERGLGICGPFGDFVAGTDSTKGRASEGWRVGGSGR